MPIDETRYAYGGARALVQLHETHLRAFVETWKRAEAAGLVMPASDDPDCVSLAPMLRHVLGAARHYMLWVCEHLQLSDPGIDAVPDEVERDPDAYLEHVLAGWDGPLHHVDQKTIDRTTADASWGVVYCIDAMLEHAVMHPIRHTLQLDRAMQAD